MTGFLDYLDRPVLLPDAGSFTDLLVYLGEWAATDNPQPVLVGRNEVGPYCTVDLSQLGGPHHRGIAVQATRPVLTAVSRRIITPDDRLSFQIIGHKATGRALVLLQHGYIIGSHWLAYIDPATIPAAP